MFDIPNTEPTARNATMDAQPTRAELPAHSAEGPFTPGLNALLSQSFAASLSGLTVSVGEDALNDQLGAHAHTHDRHISLCSDVRQDVGDARSMEIIAHEVSHALAGRSAAPSSALDREGDLGEAGADEAGQSFAAFASSGGHGPAPVLRPAHGGQAAVHRFKLEGPWNLFDPVHETLTQRSLRKAGLIKENETFGDAAAWEYTRGAFWNDDPECLLFGGNARGDFSTGNQYRKGYTNYEKRAANGEQYGVGSPLLARTHFGDMSPLHGMAGRDGEKPEETRAKMMMWAEFTSKIALGQLAGDAKLGDIKLPGFEMFAGDKNLASKSISEFFGVGPDGGDVKKRAMGSLLHMIQDSYAGGHADREDLGQGHRGRIKSFYAYSHQDHDKHAASDYFPDGKDDAEKLAKLPGHDEAIEQGAAVLRLLNKKDASWEEVQKYLDQNTFAMVDKPGIAGPGDNYMPTPKPVAQPAPAPVPHVRPLAPPAPPAPPAPAPQSLAPPEMSAEPIQSLPPPVSPTLPGTLQSRPRRERLYTPVRPASDLDDGPYCGYAD